MYWGLWGREGGRGWNKILFLLPLFIFFPLLFFVSVFVPVNAIAEYTPSEHLFLTVKEDDLEVSYISWFFPECPELVGRKAMSGLSLVSQSPGWFH